VGEKGLIKVLVADDSAIMRTLTSDLIRSAGGFEVVGTASNGKEAADLCCKLKPDVVLMDMLMGENDGIMGTKLIMEKCPTPVIILSALEKNDASPIMEALNAGAIDYHKKPNRTLSNTAEQEAELIEKVRAAKDAQLSVLASPKPIKVNSNEHTFTETHNYDVVVIGSSTGGPSAVESVITKLPGNLNVPVLIAQHMPVNFVPSFAQRLDALTPLKVVLGDKDMEVKPGHIYIAPGGKNMIIRRDYRTGKVLCDFTEQKFKEFNYPSATGLMYSVVEVYKNKIIGVVLTGMGKDASEGLKAIKDAGGYTIAQSKETCVVFGMPGSSVEIGAVTKIVPVDEIGPFIVSCLE
jgi:two-component system, chemotaxis family, protein-glutamate methylesterase/glutaminase